WRLLAADLLLERGQALGESRLARAPQLRVELALDGALVRGDARHVVDRLLSHDDQLAGGARGAARKLLGDAEQLIVVDALVRQPNAFRFGAVQHLTEHDRRHRSLRADDPALHPRVSPAWMNPDLKEPGVEPCPPGCDADVAPEGQVHAR